MADQEGWVAQARKPSLRGYPRPSSPHAPKRTYNRDQIDRPIVRGPGEAPTKDEAQDREWDRLFRTVIQESNEPVPCSAGRGHRCAEPGAARVPRLTQPAN